MAVVFRNVYMGRYPSRIHTYLTIAWGSRAIQRLHLQQKDPVSINVQDLHANFYRVLANLYAEPYMHTDVYL